MASKKTDAGDKAATETPAPIPDDNIPRDASGEPIFIEEKIGDKTVRRPNPNYMATAAEDSGKYNPKEIYNFVYIGPCEHMLPKIEEVEFQRGGKTISEWIQTGGELSVLPGQRVNYLGWIGNHIDSDFVPVDESAITKDWKYPWSEDTIIERFKRVPPQLFDDFCKAYFDFFGDRRPKVQEFFFETSAYHRENIRAAEAGPF